jgi:uncharacterized protein
MLTKETIQRAVQRIVAEVHPSQIILFGSYGRGQATSDSDLDLIVIQPHVEDQGQEMVQLRQVVGSIGVGVDILVYSREEYARRSQVPGTVLYWAQREGQTLYEATS